MPVESVWRRFAIRGRLGQSDDEAVTLQRTACAHGSALQRDVLSWHFVPPVNAPARNRSRAWLWFLIPLVASAWTRDWWAPDEPRYAEVAREIYSCGNYLVMHLNGEIYRNKPPLLFWLSGLLGSFTGWNELAMRVPSLVATLLSAWLTARLARRFWGEDEARLAPILYLTTGMVLWHGTRMQIDPLLGALCMGALVLASEPCTISTRRARMILCAGLLSGLAVLAKGPIAFVLIGIPLAGWRWIAGPHPQRVSKAAWISAGFAAVIPALVWALTVVARHPELAYDLFLGQFFERAIKGTNHISPVWSHFTLQPLMMLPWTPLAFAGSWLAWRALVARRRGETFDLGIAQAGWWFWALLVAFSLSPEKRDLYLLPAYPAVALLSSRWIAQALRVRRNDRWLAAPVPALLALIGIALCGVGFFQSRLPPEFPSIAWQSVAVGLSLAGGAALAVRESWRGEHARATLALAGGLAIAVCVASLIVFPLVNPAKSSRSLAAYLLTRPERPTAIPCVGVMPEGFRFYSGLPIVQGPGLDHADPKGLELQEQSFLESARREGPDFLALVAERNWLSWSEATRAAFEIRHAQSVSARKVLVLGLQSPPTH